MITLENLLYCLVFAVFIVFCVNLVVLEEIQVTLDDFLWHFTMFILTKWQYCSLKSQSCHLWHHIVEWLFLI